MFPSRALWEAISPQFFKQAQTGLYHGKMKQFGNNVPFSYRKTRRTWLPNVQFKRLPSDLLSAGGGGELIRVKLTTRALRTIKKKGGLDNYLKTTSAELLGEAGMRLRMRLLEEERKRMKRELKEYKIVRLSLEEERERDTEELQRRRERNRGSLSLSDSELNGPDDARPSLETARSARRLAADALRREEPASAKETIAYLKKLAEKRGRRRAPAPAAAPLSPQTS